MVQKIIGFQAGKDKTRQHTVGRSVLLLLLIKMD